MAGTDNHRNSGSRRVNMKIWVESLALTETCPATNFHVYWYTAIELRVFKKKKKKKKTNTIAIPIYRVLLYPVIPYSVMN